MNAENMQEPTEEELSDDALRVRALVADRKRLGYKGGRKPTTHLNELIKAIDALGREPTEDEIRRLAWRFSETYTVVETAVKFRRERTRHGAKRLGSKQQVNCGGGNEV